MRATFTTEFIYDGGVGYLDRKRKMCECLDVPFCKNGTVIGQLSGILKGLDLGEGDIRVWLREQCDILSDYTKVEFNIVYILEGGEIIIKKVKPKL